MRIATPATKTATGIQNPLDGFVSAAHSICIRPNARGPPSALQLLYLLPRFPRSLPATGVLREVLDALHQHNSNPCDNPLHNTWGKRIGLSGLQATQLNGLKLHSTPAADAVWGMILDQVIAKL